MKSIRTYVIIFVIVPVVLLVIGVIYILNNPIKEGEMCFLPEGCGLGYQIRVTVYNELSKVFKKGDNNKPAEYSCPKTEWIDCMPIVDPKREWECSPTYLKWTKENCPDFKGAAL